MRNIRPIPVNIGGPVDPKHLVGRDREVDRVFRAFESVGVVLTGERRMGKTSLARLVADRARSMGWEVVWVSGEGVTTAGEFSARLVSQLDATGGRLTRAVEALRGRWGFKAAGFEIAPADEPRFLDEVLANSVAAADSRMLLVLDELPILARELERRQPGDGLAMLHTLRRQRQEHPHRLRILCLGSIGFHHVVRGESDGSLNDLDKQRLGPLSSDDATYLSACLIEGSGLATTDAPAVARAISREVEGVPFYVHRFVYSALERAGAAPIAPEDAWALVEAAIADPDDPWELRHYRKRIPRYFGDDARLADATLSALARSESGATLNQIAGLLDAQPAVAPVDCEQVRDVVERLESDHYLVREGQLRRFAFSLVRRAWLANQD